MGAMYIIHASITEYLIIFGTPLGTEGHTGMHTADDYFHILQGEQWAFRAGALEMERYGPGEVHWLRRGETKQYKMHEGCWAMEYARGGVFFPSCVYVTDFLIFFACRMDSPDASLRPHGHGHVDTGCRLVLPYRTPIGSGDGEEFTDWQDLIFNPPHTTIPHVDSTSRKFICAAYMDDHCQLNQNSHGRVFSMIIRQTRARCEIRYAMRLRKRCDKIPKTKSTSRCTKHPAPP